MNNVILTLDHNKIDPTVSAENRENYFVRRAARAVLNDENGQIALLYAGQRKYYKLPGGGIDEGEEIFAAMARELLEETGCIAEIVQDLGIVIEWRDFDTMHQISYAFKAVKIRQDFSPSFTQSELDEGFEIRWVSDIDEAIRLVESEVGHDDIEVKFMAMRDTAILRAAK